MQWRPVQTCGGDLVQRGAGLHQVCGRGQVTPGGCQVQGQVAGVSHRRHRGPVIQEQSDDGVMASLSCRV